MIKLDLRGVARSIQWIRGPFESVTFIHVPHIGFRNNIHFVIHRLQAGSSIVMVEEMNSVELGERRHCTVWTCCGGWCGSD